MNTTTASVIDKLKQAFPLFSWDTVPQGTYNTMYIGSAKADADVRLVCKEHNKEMINYAITLLVLKSSHVLDVRLVDRAVSVEAAIAIVNSSLIYWEN